MRCCFFFLICLFLFLQSTAQAGPDVHFFEKKIAHYNHLIQNAKNDSAKIIALGNLAEFYYIYRAERQADSVLQKQLLAAETANNKNLVLHALFSNAIDNIGRWASIETFDKALLFAEKGLKYAKESNNKEFEAIAHLRKAGLYRKRSQYDNAFQEASLAFPLLEQHQTDSLKTALFIEIGDIFLAKGQIVNAYKNYNSAFDIAYSIKNIPLQSRVYHHLSALYQSLKDNDQAKKSLLHSLDLNLTHNNKMGLLLDYYDLARLTDEKEYIDKALLLADSLQSERYKLHSKRLVLAYLMVVQKDSKAALDYLRSQPDLNQSYLNTGKANYHWNIGNIYRYSGEPDSAIYYYSMAEPEMQASFEVLVRSKMCKEIGECYLLMNNTPKATQYFEQAFALGKQLNNLDSNAVISSKLSTLYAGNGDYKKAYEYNNLYINYTDSLQALANDRNLVLLEVERENRKHELDMQEQERLHEQSRNLQYIGISIAVALVFIIMILIGMFPVSKFVIRMLGFCAFILLFEFFIVMIDMYLHHATHGQPLKIWLAKIVIIALLVPIHHYMEHAMVHFLESQKLIKLRQQFSVKKIWISMKKPAPRPAAIEEAEIL